MNFKYKTVLIDDYHTLEPLPTQQFCCGSLSDAFANELVVLGDVEYGPKQYPVLSVIRYRPDWDGGLEKDFYPISFCPFCGEKIETEEGKRVRRNQVMKTETVAQHRWVTEEVDVTPVPPTPPVDLTNAPF